MPWCWCGSGPVAATPLFAELDTDWLLFDTDIMPWNAKPPAWSLGAREPLWRIHECVFAVPALESDPVDPRL